VEIRIENFDFDVFFRFAVFGIAKADLRLNIRRGRVPTERQPE
jgi:hypothetical protein